MPAPTPRAAKAIPQQGNSFVADFAGMGTVNGSTRVIEFRSQATVTTWPTPPAGFVAVGLGAFPASDRSEARFAKYITDVSTEPSSYTIAAVAGGGNSRIEAHVYIMDDVDPAHLNDGGTKYQASGTLPAGAALGVPYTVVAMVGAEYTAGNSCVPTTPAGYTPLLISQTAGGATPVVVPNNDTTGSRTGLATYYRKVESGSLTVDAVPFTWTSPASTPTDPKSASWIVRGQAVGVPVKLGDGSVARLSYIDEGGVRRAPASVSLWLPGFSDVTSFLAKYGATIDHRGGSLENPEFAEISYDRAVRRGFGVHEFSCGFSLDLVPFGLGDQYLDTAAGVTGNVDPTTMPWATIASAYQNKLRPVAPGVFQPFYRLEQFLTKYTPNHVVAVDPKFGAGSPTKIAAMLDICDAIGGPSKIVIKYDSPITGSDLVVAAKARGYTTMNYWGIEVDKLTNAYHVDKWDLVGVRYDADQAMYNAASSFGKHVWAAVIPNQAGYATAMSRGASLAMCSSINGITPVSVG